MTNPVLPNVDTPGKTILVALTGSHAYGLERPGSDLDFRGVYACTADRMLSLRPPRETVDVKHPDVTLHELRKFCKLAAAANPTVLEVLWAPTVLRTVGGDALINHRRAFLSKRARNTYGGYAIQQLEKAARGTGGSRGVNHLKREKFLLHTLRLVDAGLHLIVEGDLQVRVPDPDALRELARRPLEVVAAHVDAQLAAMDSALDDSPLPDEPDYNAIDSIMAFIRGTVGE